MPTETFQSLLARHAALSFEKQYALTDFLGSHNWSLDIGREVISFRADRSFPVQILGTESQSTDTWLWAWANAESGLSDSVVRDSNTLRKLGEEAGVHELATPEIDLGKISGHHLALIASGVCNAAAYYRGAYDGGAVYVLLYDPEKVIERDDSVIRMSRVFLDLISQIELEHRPAFSCYARARGLDLVEDHNTIVCRKASLDVLRATFDSYSRLAELASTLGPES